MKRLIFLLFTGCVVKCVPVPSSNYFVVEMPESATMKQTRNPLKVFWNVPTMQCASKRILFENLDKFGIIQNKNDSFRGEKIAILYDPGMFPALLKEDGSGKFRFRNGGVPQEGSLEKHLEAFQKTLEESIPDQHFSGVGVIDFESWRPVFRQNFGTLSPYKDVSYEIENKRHMWWPKSWIQSEARKRFEEAGRMFMESTLQLAKNLRPHAQWGYYAFPYCFNMQNNHMGERCADNVPEENDKIQWLWSESTALYPSVYSSKTLTTSQLTSLVSGRVQEAARVARGAGRSAGGGVEILPYYWFRYREGGYMTKEDLEAVLKTIYNSDAAGIIIWGSSGDVNTVELCQNLFKYVNNVLGPTIAKFTKSRSEESHIFHDLDSYTTTENTNYDVFDIPTDNIGSNNTSNVTDTPKLKIVPMDPDFDWEPPENYEQDIIKYVEEHLKNSGNDSKNVTHNDVILDLLFRAFSDNQNIENDKNNSDIVKHNLDSSLFNVTDNLDTTISTNLFITTTKNPIDENIQVRQIRTLTTEDSYLDILDESTTTSIYKYLTSTTKFDVTTQIDDFRDQFNNQETFYFDYGDISSPDYTSTVSYEYTSTTESIASTKITETTTFENIDTKTEKILEFSTTETTADSKIDFTTTDKFSTTETTTSSKIDSTTTEKLYSTTELNKSQTDEYYAERAIEDLGNVTSSSLVFTDIDQVVVTVV